MAGRIFGANGQPIDARAQDRERAMAAQFRFGNLALQAIAVFLYEKKDKKRTLPKGTIRSIVESNLNLVIREDAENVYLELQETEPREEEPEPVRCVAHGCGELEQNRVHRDDRLGAFHAFHAPGDAGFFDDPAEPEGGPDGSDR
jgi:hypothetical protein